jgi:type I restriction enzyme S subunit
MPVSLPPLAEQRRIVAEVERRLSVVAEVEATVAANLKRAERLRQSVLKRAFEGRLVPQDPSEASVEALLSAATPLEHQTENVALNRATAPAETLADEAPQRKRGRPSKVRQERLEGM